MKLDLTKWSKKWIPKLQKYLVCIEETDMTIYALISKDLKRKKVVKTIIKGEK